MSIDTIGNFLTIIRNGIMASKLSVVAPLSKMNKEIARILLQEGFIRKVEEVAVEGKGTVLKITLKYVNGESAIHKLTRESKPGHRVYVGVKKIKPVVDGLGISILSTNRGVMTDKQAKSSDQFVGGELICSVW